MLLRYALLYFALTTVHDTILNALPVITIKGISLPLTEHIAYALKTDKAHFNALDFMRTDGSTFSLIPYGHINLTQEDFDNIMNDRYCFVPFYKKERRNQRAYYEDIGAVILGTQDHTLDKKLLYASLMRTIK